MFCFGLTAALACGPASPVAPTPVQVPLSGTLTSLQTGAPIAGAAVRSTGPSALPTITDAFGAYTIWGFPGVWEMTFLADGFVPRRTRLPVTDRTVDIRVNAISLDPPFSLEYYREVVRGARDFPDRLLTLARWTEAPRFFFLTRTVDAGDPVPDVIFDRMEEFASFLTPRLTGGRFSPAGFGRGPDRPASTSGWIIVESYSDGIPGAPGAGGDALVGVNPGRIRLLLNPSPRVSCTFAMAGAFYHEVVHALGFWHVSGGFSVDNLCGDLLPALEYHAGIAYSRPVGNLDPDTDPQFTIAPAAIAIR
jgi:hypothetical protein